MSDAVVKKARNPKREPLSHEVFEEHVSNTCQSWSAIVRYYTGPTKKSINFCEHTPGKTELTNLTKYIQGLGPAYAKIGKKKPKKHTVKSNKNRGFKQEHFVAPGAITFANNYGNLPPNLKLIPLTDVGGWAIWNNAQATQLITAYIETEGLKDPNQRSKITFDKNLTELFTPYFSTLKKKDIVRENDKIIIKHTILQSLIPKLFDTDLPVPPVLFTPDEKTRLAEREKVLKARTDANRQKREDSKKKPK
jgi:hypothetical protein